MADEQEIIKQVETVEGEQNAQSAAVENVAAESKADVVEYDMKFEPNAKSAPQVVEKKAEAKQEQIQAQLDWKEAIKGIDKKEVLKTIGHEELELDDWEKDFIKHTRNGGSRAEYLEAKAKDWGKVDTRDLVFIDLKEQYPTLSDEDVATLVAEKYKIELDTDGNVISQSKVGEITEKADADKYRQAQIEKQGKFTIKEREKQEVNPEAIAQQQQQEREAIVKNVMEDPFIKSLYETKKITLDIEGFGKFNLPVNPKDITDYMLDSEVQRQCFTTDKGEPNSVRAIQSAFVSRYGLEKIIAPFLDLAKSASKKELIDEDRNIKKDARPAGGDNGSKVSWKVTGGNDE